MLYRLSCEKRSQCPHDIPFEHGSLRAAKLLTRACVNDPNKLFRWR